MSPLGLPMKKVTTCAAHVIAGAALQIGRVAPCYGYAIHETKGVATSRMGSHARPVQHGRFSITGKFLHLS